ncbi:hypothetical protein, partial [Pseudomonas petrae]
HSSAAVQKADRRQTQGFQSIFRNNQASGRRIVALAGITRSLAGNASIGAVKRMTLPVQNAIEVATQPRYWHTVQHSLKHTAPTFIWTSHDTQRRTL